MHRRLAAAFLAAFVVIVATAAPAAAATSSGNDRQISVVGDITVPEGRRVHGPVITADGKVRVDGRVDGDVVVGSGSLDVSGTVHGDVLVIHGDARVSGTVTGTVVASDGRVVVVDGATVGKDVISRQPPRVADGTVQGDVKRLDLRSLTTRFIVVLLAFIWLSTTLSVAVLGTLFVGMFPKGADTAVAAGRRFGRSLGWGAVLGIVGPFVAALVFASVVGIPLALGMFGGLMLLAPLGYVVTCLLIGRRWVHSDTPRGRVGAFFAGFGVLRILALIPGVGLVVWLVASIYGLGALAVAAWYGGHYRPDETTAPAALPPPPREGAAETAGDRAAPVPQVGTEAATTTGDETAPVAQGGGAPETAAESAAEPATGAETGPRGDGGETAGDGEPSAVRWSPPPPA